MEKVFSLKSLYAKEKNSGKIATRSGENHSNRTKGHNPKIPFEIIRATNLSSLDWLCCLLWTAKHYFPFAPMPTPWRYWKFKETWLCCFVLSCGGQTNNGIIPDAWSWIHIRGNVLDDGHFLWYSISHSALLTEWMPFYFAFRSIGPVPWGGRFKEMLCM